MKRELRGPLTLFLIGLALDQASKFVAQRFFGNDVHIIGNFLRFSLAHNYGFSFSMGMGLPAWLRIGLQLTVPVVVLVFIATQLSRKDLPGVEAYALAALAAGALGNLIDRLFFGYVVDFIVFKMYGFLGFQYWPTFNVADTCLVLGAITFAFVEVFSSNAGKHGDATEIP